MTNEFSNDDFPICPICGLKDTIDRPNIHVRTKYDESIFGVYILQDPSAKWNLTAVDQWITRILGPDAALCLEERYDGDVLIHGTMMIMDGNSASFNWTRASSPIVLIQILKDESFFNILLDPRILA